MVVNAGPHVFDMDVEETVTDAAQDRRDVAFSVAVDVPHVDG
jgi:hypothetical protein